MRLLSCVLSLSLCFFLFGCGGDGGGRSSNGSSLTEDALYAPLVGTYTMAWTGPYPVSSGGGTVYVTDDQEESSSGGKTGIKVLGLQCTPDNAMPEAPVYSTIGVPDVFAVAYPDKLKLNSLDNAISQLTFAFTDQDAPEGAGFHYSRIHKYRE